jgi:hypothetical protein
MEMTEIERRPIEASRYTRSLKARRLRGAAALMEALELIGASNATDHDMAKVIVDYELELREFLAGALRDLQSTPAE